MKLSALISLLVVRVGEGGSGGFLVNEDLPTIEFKIETMMMISEWH